ncbi:hypothetical protein EUGRSUZ_C04280 [Eucalyptus grandis]|uniref:Uncharacterized protein n=2 Tax=Eucalyptus grandis TaxID=71139 RepID=A0ACC3LKQ6_EUCGR|nr:hypothetical protein EUGRSUZ_C04280 [Eucalyptus grandis]
MGCLKEERNALLVIEATFNHLNGSYLPSWREGNGDCCYWEGVVCDNTTSRATQLYLNSTRRGKFGVRKWEAPWPWVIRASFFLPL